MFHLTVFLFLTYGLLNPSDRIKQKIIYNFIKNEIK
jgi:hypothetical protein